MRILQVVSGYPPMLGGIENSVHELVRRLRLRGHETFVVTASGNSSSSVKNGVYFLSTPLKIEGEWGEIFICPSILNVLKKIDFEVAHAHVPRKFFAEALPIVKILYRKNFPYVVSVRLINVSLPPLLRSVSFLYFKTIEKQVFKRAERIVVQTEFNRRLLSETCGIPLEKIEIIPNAVDTEIFNPQRFRIEDLREKYGVKAEKTVLYAGRLTSQKGLIFLMKSIPKVLKDFSDIEFIIVGKGPLESRLRRMTKRFSIHSHIKFLNSVPHRLMPELYALADIFVLPSLSESFPNAVLEAMAMEKPTITTKVGVIPEIFTHGKHTFLINAGDVKELTNALLMLLCDETLSRELGRNSRKLVKTKYSWERVLEKTLNLYQEILR